MRILAVLALYKKKIKESPTYISLLNSYFKNKLPLLDFFLLVYDNSPNQQELLPNIPFKYQYIHDPYNRGLSVAYNVALRTAIFMNSPWLLLLDQDSKLSHDYFSTIGRTLKINSSNESIVAYVPKVACNDSIVSPSRVIFGGQFRPININFVGPINFHITAINSGTLLRVAYLESIQGFNNLFQLDYLDHWLFNKIHLDSKKVYVFNSIVQHDLSISDMDANMDLPRYINILHSEKLFYLKYKSKGENIFYLIKLFIRFLRLTILLRNKKFAFIVLKQLYDSAQTILQSSKKK